MDFAEVVKNRRSVRAFQQRKIEEEKMRWILEAMNSAPSAGNLQAYEVVLVKDEERKKQLAQAALEQDFIAEAPEVLVFFAHPKRCSWRYGKRGVQLYCIQDATIACAYAQLGATAVGLASCWVGAFLDGQVRRIVGAPADLVPICILPIGYPAESPAPTPRRSLSDIVRKEKFG